jgi:head-tail adaptor
LVTEAWVGIKDMLPSRGERLADGINVATRPARLRMRWREGMTSDMRFVLGSRIMQIVAGPAELGRRDGLEFMVEEYSTAGSGA